MSFIMYFTNIVYFSSSVNMTECFLAGYGQSTHATTSVTELPSFESDSLPWWIWVLIASLVTLAVLIIILVVCLKKPRKCQVCQEEPSNVFQEIDENCRSTLVVSWIHRVTASGICTFLKVLQFCTPFRTSIRYLTVVAFICHLQICFIGYHLLVVVNHQWHMIITDVFEEKVVASYRRTG